jgi:hypothetical protein
MGHTAERIPVGAPGFEPGTSCPPDKRANQAAPRPVGGTRVSAERRSRAASEPASQAMPQVPQTSALTRLRHAP